MAYFKLAERMTSGKLININNNANMYRDFIYIYDIAESITRLLAKPPSGGEKPPQQLFKINIGHGDPVNLMDFIQILEDKL